MKHLASSSFMHSLYSGGLKNIWQNLGWCEELNQSTLWCACVCSSEKEGKRYMKWKKTGLDLCYQVRVAAILDPRRHPRITVVQMK